MADDPRDLDHYTRMFRLFIFAVLFPLLTDDDLTREEELWPVYAWQAALRESKKWADNDDA